MQKYFDINKEGFSVRCKLYYHKNLHDLNCIVVATYGFGGNKDNKAIEKFSERITSKYKHYGVICFDWPAHGQDARNKLVIEECMTYLRLVNTYIQEEMGITDLYHYASSFGAYVLLRMIHEEGSCYKKIALRCPAIKMYDSLTQDIDESEWSKLAKGKEIIRGFDRKIKLDQAFFDDLKHHDIGQYDYLEYADDILMIHGTKDTMVPIEVTRQFSENNVIELLEVENADHPFSNPKYMDEAIDAIIHFFSPISH